MMNKKILFAMTLFLTLLYINGCVQTPTRTVKSIEKINQTVIIQSDDGTVALWSSSSVKDGLSGEIKYAKGGIRVTAFEKEVGDYGDYHIKTDTGKEGWVSWADVSEDVLCAKDDDCSKYLFVDFCLDGLCVECKTTRDCNGDDICHPEKHRCVDCLSNKDCSSVSPVCNLEGNECAECWTDDDCPPSTMTSISKQKTKFCIIDDKYAFKNKCVECKDNSNCPENEWCRTDMGICVIR